MGGSFKSLTVSRLWEINLEMCSDPSLCAQHRPLDMDTGSRLVLTAMRGGKSCPPFTNEEAKALRGEVPRQGHTSGTIHVTWTSGRAGAVREDFLEVKILLSRGLHPGVVLP